ncbi:hypothetical protein GCM10010282_46100 [Streptomyces roseolus]|nr:hypothetical protein GCM10010282_46100 [Streptomyces roseolus]
MPVDQGRGPAAAARAVAPPPRRAPCRRDLRQGAEALPVRDITDIRDTEGGTVGRGPYSQ